VRHALAVTGIPSRARVSPDGRYGAVTLFVSGHAYADPGSFSTQTTLIDLATGSRIGDLEQFTVFRGSRQVTATDVNYWGVTFGRDSDRFYATLATAGTTYLIEGSVSGRRARVIHENVECPSLSPDGTRIAYKKRTGSGSAPWHLTVLDLATKHETPLADARSVDDQVEWLDDTHVLYAVDGAVWAARADGTGEPRRYIARADSPAAVRW
jgi:Tol biopolymer transport system component